MIEKIMISILILVYFIFTYYVRIRINKSLYLTEKRRSLHKKFIWILPFLGPLIIRGFWKKKEKGLNVMTKQKRKFDKSNFYESGKGIFGG